MKVKVQYLGPMRVLAKKREEEIEIPLKSTVYELLLKLSNMYRESFKKEVFNDEKEVREGVIVNINGMSINQLEGVKTTLKIGDVVTLLPFFAGGG